MEATIDDMNYYLKKNWVKPAFSRNLNLWNISRSRKTRMKCINSEWKPPTYESLWRTICKWKCQNGPWYTWLWEYKFGLSYQSERVIKKMTLKCFKITTLSQAVRRSLFTMESRVSNPSDFTYAYRWTKWYSTTVFLEFLQVFLAIH